MSSQVDTRIEAVAGLLREQLPPEMVVTEPSAIIALVRPWKAQVKRRPSIVARCRSTADVQAAVRAAGAVGMPLSVLAGWGAEQFTSVTYPKENH